MNEVETWKLRVAALAVTVISAFLVVTQAAGGHGSYFAAKLLFPFTMLSVVPFGEIPLPFAVLALFQFPVYLEAVIIADEKNHLAIGSLIILVLHATAALTCFLIPLERFS